MRSIILAGIAATVLISSPATAQKHWCKSANLTLTERTICTDVRLRAMDGQLNRRYKATQESLAVRGRGPKLVAMLKMQQNAWIRKRNKCGHNPTCIERAYNARLAALRGPGGAKPAYSGTWGKDKAQCKTPQESQNAPMIVTARGYDQHEAHCTFKSVRKMGALWKVKAECSVQGDKIADAFTLKTNGQTLVMTTGKFSKTLIRCN